MLDNLLRMDSEQLKKARGEIDHLGRGEFLVIASQYLSEDQVALAAKLGYDDAVRDLIKGFIDTRLKELGE